MHAQPRLWSLDEYYALAEAGFLPQQHTELIEGEIVLMTPQGPEHGQSLTFANQLLVTAFGETHYVRVQLPLTVGEHTELEPDFALVSRASFVRDASRHPATADLVIEVAVTSLAYDRYEKASLYARAGVPEYWILNRKTRTLEIYREPRPDSEAPFGYGYASRRVVAEHEEAESLLSPGCMISVAELL